jgi:bifunctional DNA-binding transcriptional regulator/antitoxin component of YhaV-PrlF toxin-antitoxin module
MSKPVFDKKITVQKYPGKGGWTYISIFNPTLKGAPWVKIKGTINDFELENQKMASMKNGNFMLPLNAQFRKKTGIKEGDAVHVVLFQDQSEYIVPEDVLICLEDYPKARAFFETLTESNKKYYVDSVMEAKTMETKVSRINKMIDKLEEGKKFYDL